MDKIMLEPDTIEEKAKKFNFDLYAKALVYQIANPNTETPLTIAITGSWGRGKSSLMLTVKNIINNPIVFQEYFKNSEFKLKKTKVIYFNAWESEKELTISMALLNHIINELSSEIRFWRYKNKIKLAGKIVSKILVDLALREVSGAKRDELLKHYKEYGEAEEGISNLRESFKDAIKYFLKKKLDYEQVVIFIDDIDRCSIENSKEMIDAIHLFLSTEYCIFLLGVDIEKLQNSLNRTYPDLVVDAKQYLEKIVQLKFELPPIEPDDMKKFINEIAPPEIKKKEYIDIIADSITINPRTIKLFINTIKFQLAMSKIRGLTFKESLLIEWLVLKKNFPLFAKEIEKNRNLLIQYHSKEILEKFNSLPDEKSKTYENAKSKFFSEYPQLNEDFLKNKDLIEILNANKIEFTIEDLNQVIFQTTLTPSTKQELKPEFSQLKEIIDSDNEINYYPVRKFMKPPSIIGDDASIKEAENIMKKEKTDFLNVIENNGKFIGILTERDIRKALMKGKKRGDLIKTIFTQIENVISAQEQEKLGSIIKKMTNYGYKRLPVINESNQLVGIIDIYDIKDLFSNLSKK
jgi:CBS domain-containing protein